MYDLLLVVVQIVLFTERIAEGIAYASAWGVGVALAVALGITCCADRS